ncbi:tetratricopeptide repeat protein [Dongia sp. agr-C8]
MSQERYGAAYDKYAAGDHGAALPMFRALAEEGDPIAQCTLAQMCWSGEGAAADPAEAFRWTLKSAEQGLAPAQHNLGIHYQFGQGVAQDLGAARRWFAEAARRDHPKAQACLAILDATLPLLPLLDKLDSPDLFALEAAVARPETETMTFAGSTKHAAWSAMAKPGWVLSASRDDRATPASETFRVTEYGRTAIPMALETLKLWSARGKTTPSAAETPAPDAAQERMDLALAAYRARDYPAALRLFRALAEAGDAFAQFNMGYMHWRGEGVEADNAAALAWYAKSAEQGFAPAQQNLGRFHQFARGIPQDLDAAASWFDKARLQGESSADQDLALLRQTVPLLPVMDGMSDADLSVLYVAMDKPDAHLGTVEGSKNHALWSALARLGWMKAAGRDKQVTENQRVFLLTEAGQAAIPRVFETWRVWPHRVPRPSERSGTMPDGTDDLYRRLGGYTVLSRSVQQEDAPAPGGQASPDAGFMRSAIAAAAQRNAQAERVHPLFGVSMEPMGLQKMLKVVAAFAVLLFAAYGILGLLGLGPWGSR